jgi:putative transposase
MRPKHLKGAYLRCVSGEREDLFVMQGELVDDCLPVLGVKSKQPLYENWERLRQEVSRGLYRVDRKGVRTVAELLRFDDEREEAEEAAKKDAKLVIEQMKAGKSSINAAYKALKKQGRLTESRATIYRRIAAIHSGRAVLHHEAKGNHDRRYSDDIIKMIQEEALLHYLVPMSSYTLDKFVDYVDALAKQREYLPKDKKLSREMVWKTILEVHRDPDAARMDPKAAVAAKSTAKHMIRVSAPLERVEQDAVHLPFVVRTPWGVSRDVWLVHAIDCFSSYPLGWVFVVGSVSTSDALSCLERVMFEKKGLFEQFGIPGTYDLFGTPSLVIFDNGPENKGSRLPRVGGVGIDTLHCRSHGAHGKPFIERMNRSLKEYLEGLDGCTRFDGDDGVRDPEQEGDELPTLAQLEADVVGFFYKHWIHKELDRLTSMVFVDQFLGNTPAQVLRKYVGEEENSLSMPPDLEKWRAVRYERERLKLSRKTGITVSPFEYRGPGLDRLIKLVGEVRVDVLRDPDDFRYVWVPIEHEHGPEQVRLENKCIGPNTPAYTFAEAKKIWDEARAGDNPDEAVKEAFDAEIRARRAADSAARAKRRQSKRAASSATTSASREHDAVERAMRHTEPPPVKSAKKDDGQADLWPADIQAGKVIPRGCALKS